MSAAPTAEPQVAVDLGGGYTAVRLADVPVEEPLRAWERDLLGLTPVATYPVGARVRVANPAYATPEPDDNAGYVSPRFFGAEGTVVEDDGFGRADDYDDSVVLVRRGGVTGGERTNYIHPNWLSPIEVMPPT